ncbi:hypothetical protein SAMN04487897_1762 [Paenibacillus sp. yr247]|uniref:hypothetical protein n=1 Tax=Paenibacillus sp. yr247 TaxID=1761880 RepID=UPI000881CC71|nr:hypothetical protein [Paenibacillus sp. yr247]SDP30927.1 hypothetical protein SAMN04487897_1762 [Paenibacillus sp. yr247]
MNWTNVDGKDYAVVCGDYIYRLRKDKFVTHQYDRSHKLYETAYCLQIRDKRKNQLVFVDLGYNFFIGDACFGSIPYGKELSVDNKYWRSVADIQQRSTEILRSLGYLNNDMAI